MVRFKQQVKRLIVAVSRRQHAAFAALPFIRGDGLPLLALKCPSWR
jgi:hypothetical protein